MYPQYLQRLLRTEAHTDTAYLTGVVVRVRNKTPSFRASFDALFTLATLDNGTTVYTQTPARPATFRADVAALLRGAAARGHVSEAVVVGAYLAEVSSDTAVTPRHYRESFRQKGPSNYFHGKQAVQDAEVAA